MVVASLSPYPSPWYTTQAGPKIHVRLKDGRTGRPVAITGGTISGQLGTVVLTGTATIEDGPSGTFTYTPVLADAPAAIGRVNLQWKVTGAPGGTILAVANPIDLLTGIAAAPSYLAPTGFVQRGMNFNNQTALYAAGDSTYNINTGIAFGAYSCTPTGRALNDGPVWNRFAEDERDYQYLAAWKMKSLALGLDWHWWGGSDPTTAQAKAAFAVIDQHVAWAKKYGILLFLRLFIPPGGTQTYNGNGAQVFNASRSSAADGTTTSGQPAIGSATMGFTASDVGKTVAGTNVPGGTTILSVQSAIAATMSANATGTGSGIVFTISGTTTAWTSATDNTVFMNQMRDLWKMIATRYATEPAIGGYDLLNEPSTGYIYSVWYPYAAYLCDQINLVDSHHLKIVQSGGSGQFSSHPALTARSDIVYSIHQYGPLDFTTPLIDGPTKSYPGPVRDYDSIASRALNGSCLATGNINMGAQGGLSTSGEAVIENELITYSNVRAWLGGDPGPSTDLVGAASQVMIVTARGVGGTVAATHPAKAEVALGCKLTTQILNTDVMTGAGVIAIDELTNWPTSSYVTFDNENFTYTGKSGATGAGNLTGVTRARDGTTAATHAVGAIGRNQKYWNLTVLDQVFRVQGRSDLGSRFPMYVGEFGAVDIQPGYSQWVADMITLMNTTWALTGWSFFDYRVPDSVNNKFGIFNANAGGTYLSLTQILPSEMSNLQTLDTVLLAAVRAGL